MTSNSKSLTDAKLRTFDIFFTLTLPSFYYKKYDTIGQYHLSKQWLITMADALKFQGEVTLELTKQFNVHYHGYGTFEIPCGKPFSYYLTNWFRINTKFGMCDFQVPKDAEKVQQYIYKSKSETLEMTGITNPVLKIKKKEELETIQKLIEKNAKHEFFLKQVQQICNFYAGILSEQKEIDEASDRLYDKILKTDTDAINNHFKVTDEHLISTIDVTDNEYLF